MRSKNVQADFLHLPLVALRYFLWLQNFFCFPKLRLSSASQVEDGQEDVDDVDVELYGGRDVLLRGDGVLLAPHDLLGVVDQEHGEQERHQGRVDGLGDGVVLVEEEAGHHAEDEEDPAGREQIWTES